MITVDKAWKKILWKQIRPNFLRSTSLQILANKSGCVQTNLLLFFIYHIWGERVLGGTVFIIQTSYKMQYFIIFHHSVFRTIEARVDFYLAKPFKKFPNHLYGQPVLTFDKRQICEDILKELRFNVIDTLLSSIF